MWSKLSTLITWHDSYSGCKFTALFLTAVGVFELIPTCTRWSWLIELIQTLTICISLDQDFVGLWVFVATGDQLCWTMSLWCHSWSTLLDYGSLIPLLTIYHFILKVSFIGREWTRVPQNHWPSEVTDKLNHIMLYTLPSVVLKI
jgi:hypothetical protein